MIRRRDDLQALDTSVWPTVDLRAQPSAMQEVVARRKQAIELYANGKAMREIQKLTGINSKQVYQLLDRCLKQAEDGQIFGFRALLKHSRVNPYTRTVKLSSASAINKQGYAGAFALLLDRYPALTEWLKPKIRKQVRLRQVSTDLGMRSRLQGLSALHAGFIQQCRAAGLTAADYPLNTDYAGIRALSDFVKSEVLSHFGAAAHAAGASRPKGFPKPDNSTAATYPYQVVEFDGHRLDVRLKIVIRDPLGYVQEFEIERIWLLVIIDVCTRAVLGYNLVLSREYSRYDVIKTIEGALTPHQSRKFTLPEVGYGPAGGFPSGKLPELGYAIWQRMRLDNAKANLASDTIDSLCEFVGCFCDFGPPHQPDDRPYVERFFGTVVSMLSSRLPGFAGSNPQDLRHALADPKGNLRLFVSLAELEDLMEASIAMYNATLHSGLNGRTPLEAMEYFVRGKGAMVFWLPESKRRTMCLMQAAHRCRVRGYLNQGTRPHITLFQVRYTSPVLAASATLLGKDLRVYYNSADLRTVRAFFPDGGELGLLKAQGAWGEVGHDIKLRREIMKARGKKRMTTAINLVFIENFVERKKAEAKHSRRTATDLERTMRALAAAPVTSMPESLFAANTEAMPNMPGDSPQSTTRPKIEPRKLTIGSGYASG